LTPLPLVIETQASVTAKGLLLVVHLAALAALFLALLPAPARLAGVTLLGASLWATWKRPVAVRLRAKADGQLEVWRAAAWTPVKLRPDSVALPWLIVLRWREGRRPHNLILPADALSGDEHRRLRVWLRWKAGAPGSSRIRAS
jgi:toxin CptA